jgi:osmotically-inducible protein OsmY
MARRIIPAVCLVLLVFAVFCATVPAAQTSQDLAISAAVTEALTRENPFEYTRIDVKTFDGVVVLGGYVDEYDKMQQIVEIARKTPGVRSVENLIGVRDNRN